MLTLIIDFSTPFSVYHKNHHNQEKFYINLERTGNTVSATIPIGLQDAQEKGLIKKGDIVMLCGFGVGYSWGATIIKI